MEPISKDLVKRINIVNISKKFKIGSKENPALNCVVRFFNGEKLRELRALDNISFNVPQGQVLGIIGRNGSGKSTLLRILANIYPPDSGIVEIKGKVFYLSGFDSGIIPRLTMKENIFLISSILGLSNKQIKNTFNKIVEFSGLDNFVDVEVNKFSSGMIARLNFSITINCIESHSPDILLLDEVFNSSGDFDFQKKARKKMEELIKSGITILLVSHDLDLIKEYCNKAIWIEKGKIVDSGSPERLINCYLNSKEGKF